MHVAIVGSGFAGSILARCLRASGAEVTLIERQRHPRFALGESSTPLAGLALARLGRRYGLDDLIALASWGAWRRSLPHLECGLKRGFTFYRHEAGRPFMNDVRNGRRLLVAASPRDELADTHWLRSQVDEHLARQAVVEGVDVREGCEVRAISRPDRWRLELDEAGVARQMACDLLIDATGAPAPVLRAAGGTVTRPGRFPDTWLVYGHFEGVEPLEACAADQALPEGPYVDSRAAVHHLLHEGWMYELRFDDGVTSAGFVVERGMDPALDGRRASPEDAWQDLLARYPTLARQFERAGSIGPIRSTGRLPRRASLAAGKDWAALPHTVGFLSPMFSTGIAWSLLAVERLADALTGSPASHAAALARYAAQLHGEFDQLERLIGPAYRLRGRFDAFAAWSMLYFAIASFAEVSQRMCDPPAGGWAWEGFLGADDRRFVRAVRQASEVPYRQLPEAVGRLIAPWNVAGLADPGRVRLYPVEPGPVIASAALLGLSGEEAQRRLPRLEAPPGGPQREPLAWGGFEAGKGSSAMLQEPQ